MQRLMNLDRSRAGDLPLRPLLYAAGAAAAAAGVYYIYIRKRGVAAYTTITEAQTQLSLVDSLLDTGLMYDVDGVSVKQTDSAVPQSDIMAQMNTLRDSVQQLEEELSETRRIFDKIRRECVRQREAHNILRSQCHKIKETLLDNEKSLIATHAEAVATHEQLLESNTQLEKVKADLMYHVHKLRGRVQQLEEMLYEADITCGVIKQDHERAWEAYSILKSQYEVLEARKLWLRLKSEDA